MCSGRSRPQHNRHEALRNESPRQDAAEASLDSKSLTVWERLQPIPQALLESRAASGAGRPAWVAASPPSPLQEKTTPRFAPSNHSRKHF